MTLQEIEKDFADMSERNFRAKQVYQWLVKSVNNFDDMKNIPRAFRDILKEKYIDTQPLTTKIRKNFQKTIAIFIK